MLWCLLTPNHYHKIHETVEISKFASIQIQSKLNKFQTEKNNSKFKLVTDFVTEPETENDTISSHDTCAKNASDYDYRDSGMRRVPRHLPDRHKVWNKFRCRLRPPFWWKAE